MCGMFARIEAKVAAGGRLSADEGQFLFSPEADLHAVGQLADLVRRRKNGAAAYYNINAHVNPTNVCVHRCPLCAFSCDPDDAKAYRMSDEQILACGQEAVAAGCTELHLVGGMHPAQPLDWHVRIVRRLHEAHPRLHLKAFTAVEIEWFSRLARRPVAAVLEELAAAGLGSLPGGGAEIFAAEVRRQICPKKIDGATWLAVHRAAHRLGLRSNATMLYGHVETPAQRVDHLLALRRLQDETGGFQAMIPLAFHPENTRLCSAGDCPNFRPPSAARSRKWDCPLWPHDKGLRPGRSADDRRLPAAAGQLRSRQGILGFAGGGNGANGAGLWGRRPRRHGPPRTHPPRRRLAVARGAFRRATARWWPRRGANRSSAISLYRRVERVAASDGE